MLAVFSFVLPLLPASTRGESSKEAVPIRIIVVASQQEAERILDRLRKGADFAQLAKENSIHTTAVDGGYIGQLQPAALRDELRKAVSGLRAGSFSGRVKMPEGYAILQVLEKPPGTGSGGVNPAGILPLAAQGTVRYSADISGYGEAFLARRTQLRTIPGWEQDLHAACEARLKGVPGAMDKIQQLMQQEGVSVQRMIFLRYSLGQLFASEGEMDQTIREWEAAYRSALTNHEPIAQQLQVALGTAYLHRASLGSPSAENGMDRSHIFPGMPGALHPRLSDVQKAVEYLLLALRQDPSSVEVKWLVNVAYMTAGTYPDKVPPEFLIPPEKWSSKQNIGRFVDVAPSAGINIATTAGGLIADDFDNDGLVDIVVSQIDDCAPLHFFITKETGRSAIEPERRGWAINSAG